MEEGKGTKGSKQMMMDRKPNRTKVHDAMSTNGVPNYPYRARMAPDAAALLQQLSVGPVALLRVGPRRWSSSSRPPPPPANATGIVSSPAPRHPMCQGVQPRPERIRGRQAVFCARAPAITTASCPPPSHELELSTRWSRSPVA
jgi:hypothetical protein